MRLAYTYMFWHRFFAALAKQMALPQTACIVVAGPLSIPETDGGRAWFKAFDDQWELIQVNKPRIGMLYLPL